MLQIDDTVVSFDLLDERFVCDLASCKGECCVEGDEGAPLEDAELDIIQDLLPVIWADLSDKAKEIIEQHGFFYIDRAGEPVTSIVNGADCVFTYTDENGICKCTIEKAFREGKTDFHKPVSCHLYPVRLQKYKGFTAVNYHRWGVCDCARTLGSSLNVSVYKFLKEPWFENLEKIGTLNSKLQIKNIKNVEI
jgi:hypothetical protein